MQQVSTTGVPTGQRTRACARPAASPSTAPRDPVAPVPPVASSPAPATPERYDVLGADGAVLQLRVVEPGDQDALMDLFARVSTRTSYQRFLAVSPVAASEYVASLMGRGEDADVDAVLARSCGVVVAVASIHRVSASAAEVALLIDDEHQGEGLGTLLLEDLVARARARGIRELVALTLRSNVQMLEVFRDLGLPLRIEAEGETFGVTVGLEEPSALQEALAHRSAAAARASLERLLRPRSVLVLGGRGHRSDLGQEVLRHLRRSGFAGPVRAVNRFEDERGLETGDSGDQIPPTAADLAVIAVTPGQEVAAARSCAHAGVGAMAVLGTGPVGDLSAPAADTLLAGELRRICRGAGIRLVGPGSVGLANTDPAVGLDVSLTPHRLPAGDVTLVGDSGPVISDRADGPPLARARGRHRPRHRSRSRRPGLRPAAVRGRRPPDQGGRGVSPGGGRPPGPDVGGDRFRARGRAPVAAADDRPPRSARHGDSGRGRACTGQPRGGRRRRVVPAHRCHAGRLPA